MQSQVLFVNNSSSQQLKHHLSEFTIWKTHLHTQTFIRKSCVVLKGQFVHLLKGHRYANCECSAITRDIEDVAKITLSPPLSYSQMLIPTFPQTVKWKQ